MPERAASQPRRRRRWIIALVVLLAILVAGTLLLRHFTRPQTLSALLVGKSRDLIGADLALHGSARFEFLPNLHVVLPHPTLAKMGSPEVFLRLDSLEAVVPWHNMWSDRYDIERIDLVRPVLDLDALQRWLDAQPATNPATPDVRFSLRVTDGSIIRGGKPLAQGLNMQLASAGDVRAWLERFRADPATTSLLPPIAGNADASVLRFGGTRLEGVQIRISDDEPASEPAQQP